MQSLHNELNREKRYLKDQRATISRIQQRIEDTERRIARLERLISRKAEQNRAKSRTLARDRDGAEIKVGDTVETLTEGKYFFTEGTITKIQAHVTIESKDRRKSTDRAPHNVRILKPSEKDGRSDDSNSDTTEPRRNSWYRYDPPRRRK